MKNRLFKLLAALMALAMIFSLAACGGTAGETTETTTTEPNVVGKTPQPMSSTETLKYFNTVMDAVKTGKPAVSPKISKNVGSIETDNAKLKAVIPTIKKYMLNTDADSAAYGSDLTNIFPVNGQSWSSRLTPGDIRYASCLETKKTYDIIIRFKDEKDPLPLTSSIGKAFDLTEKSSILEQFKKSAEYMTVDKLDLVYTGCYILCSVDKATDQVLSVTYILNVLADTVVTGTGTLQDMGSVPLSLKYDKNATYTLDWTKPE